MNENNNKIEVSRDTKKVLAKILFVSMKHSRKDIAEQLNLDEKTVGAWARDGNWEALQAQREQYGSRKEKAIEYLNNLYDKIDDKQKGLPTDEDTKVMDRLMKSIREEEELSFEKKFSILKQFTNFLENTQQEELAKQIAKIIPPFLESTTLK